MDRVARIHNDTTIINIGDFRTTSQKEFIKHRVLISLIEKRKGILK